MVLFQETTKWSYGHTPRPLGVCFHHAKEVEEFSPGERLFFRDWPADPTVGPWDRQGITVI